MGGKNPSAPKPDPKELWGNYSRWVSDTNKLYDKQVSSAKARMSAGGMQAGTPDWDKTIEGLEAKRTEELAAHKKSTTYQLLEEGRKREGIKGRLFGRAPQQDDILDETTGGSLGRLGGRLNPAAREAREERAAEMAAERAEQERVKNLSTEDWYAEKYGNEYGPEAGEAPEDTTAPDEQRRPRGKTIVADQPSPWMGGA